jgi:hypothetical protein
MWRPPKRLRSKQPCPRDDVDLGDGDAAGLAACVPENDDVSQDSFLESGDEETSDPAPTHRARKKLKTNLSLD